MLPRKQKQKHSRLYGQFAAEDYCASSRIIRTPSRYEMLYARSSVVAVAHAYNLAAIDLVCVKYKGEEAEAILRDESEEGRRLGFTGGFAGFASSHSESEKNEKLTNDYELGRQTSDSSSTSLDHSESIRSLPCR